MRVHNYSWYMRHDTWDIDGREGASVLKWCQAWNYYKKMKKCQFSAVFILEKQNKKKICMKKMINREIFNDFNTIAISLLSLVGLEWMSVFSEIDSDTPSTYIPVHRWWERSVIAALQGVSLHHCKECHCTIARRQQVAVSWFSSMAISSFLEGSM